MREEAKSRPTTRVYMVAGFFNRDWFFDEPNFAASQNKRGRFAVSLNCPFPRTFFTTQQNIIFSWNNEKKHVL